jgi:hypothetical protein
MSWDPDFIERSPMLAPLAGCGAKLSSCAKWPRRELLQDLLTSSGVCNRRGIPIRLIEPVSNVRESYEDRLYLHGQLQVRPGDWHDLFNVLAWLAYPRTKAALNERHFNARVDERGNGREGATDRPGKSRGRVRDALTLFDESGAIIAYTDPGLIDDLNAFRWKRLFWERRERVLATSRVYVFGHAIFQKALEPYVGMTACAKPLAVSADFLSLSSERQLARIDELGSECVSDPQAFAKPQMLAPLPLLGVPGWWAPNERESFYENETYFRRGRAKRAAEND